MKLQESVSSTLRPLLIWTAAFILGVLLFRTVDNMLEPEQTTTKCEGLQPCWDLRSMWN
ncbi:MAG TPA: hypothetical protein VEI73_06220 [Candidatus Acidoferrum sp.]|nr:hypothetical protein [Candidatus Acidoferrum sp.]